MKRKGPRGGGKGRTGGGATQLGDAVDAALTLQRAIDYFPSIGTQRTLVYASDGSLRKADEIATTWTSLVTGLTTAGAVPAWAIGGQESAGRDRKAFFADRINAPRVLAADGATVAALATPNADWSGSNQPGWFFPHQGRMVAGGNANAAHTAYVSLLTDHEDFGSTPLRFLLGPYEHERRTVGGISYKGLAIIGKEPEGMYAIDTRDASTANWLVARVSNAGLAGPNAIITVEDDVLWIDPEGGWHLISASDALGSVKASELTYRKLGTFARDEMNLARSAYFDLVYYSHKLDVQLAFASIGQTGKDRRLHLDLNRRADLGERWVTWDRDRNECLFMREVSSIQIPAMGDNVGQLWLLDQVTRSQDGSAYTFEWQLRDTDFSAVVPGWAGRLKNGAFLQLEYDARDTATHTIEVIQDGVVTQTINFTLEAGAAALPLVLPFTLGHEFLQTTVQYPLYGQFTRLALRGYTTTVADISISRVLIGAKLASLGGRRAA